MLFRRVLMLGMILFLIFLTAGAGITKEVAQYRARTVAQNWLHHLKESHGFGNSEFISPEVKIIGEEVMVYKNRVVGYNFILSPRGHIIVPFQDELPPVKLYSDTATLRMADDSDVAEWIREELFKVYEAMDSHKQELDGVDFSTTCNGKLWSLFGVESSSFPSEYMAATSGTESLSIGPLLTTTWAQGDPYNQYCPLWNAAQYVGVRTVTGCVATAAAQIMKYWNYPASGQGSTSYTWNDGSADQTLSGDFSLSTYQWSLMKNSHSSGDTPAEKDAVARLMSDIGIAFHMNYGVSALGGSGAATLYGETVYPTYFKYKSTISAVYRTSYASDSAWMQVFRDEVQNGRPSQLRIKDPDAGGHSIVVDGYRDSPSEQIHLNLGWSGSYDGWYVSNNIVTGSYDWSDVNYQAAVIGIEPPSVPGGIVDFDADRKTDIAVYHSTSGLWFIKRSSDAASYSVGYGGSGYVPIPGDFDGDRKTDTAVYHSGSGLWFIKRSSDAVSYSVGYGGSGCVPVPGDYDGDGKTDIAVYHSTSGLWFIKKSSDGTSYSIGYGGTGYDPVLGDFDGDRKTDIAVYHSATGLWFMKKSSDGTSYYVGYGGTGYVPVPGDYDGDGKTDIAVYHSASGLWFIKPSSGAADYYVGYGGTGYVPVPGDYDGDGKVDVAVYHQATGLWFIKPSSGAADYYVGYGGTGYEPVNLVYLHGYVY